MAKGIFRGLALGVTASLLVACGGGGGGGGGGSSLIADPINEITVSVRPDRGTLPLNISGQDPQIGGPHTTTLYVTARAKDGSALSGEDLFSFTFEQGFETAQLYYLDGDREHEVEVDDPNNPGEKIFVPAAFRFGTLDAAANGATMHLHARPGGSVGTATIKFAVTSQGKEYSGRVSVQIGGASSGKPSQVVVTDSGPNFLFAQGVGGTTQLPIQVRVVDEAGQPVPDPVVGVSNLFVQIVTNDPFCAAGNTAMLRSGLATGKAVTASTLNGNAQFTAISGVTAGTLCIEFYSDRADNNVANGIAEPVFNTMTEPVVFAVASSPLALNTENLPDAFLNTPYSHFLTASGGIPGYRWALVRGSELPSGLTLSPDGVISGTPLHSGDNVGFIVQVTDALNKVVERALSLNVKGDGGSGVTITTTALPEGTQNSPYSAVILAARGAPPYIWSMVGSIPGLALSQGGVLSGTPTAGGTFTVGVTVTDSNGLSTTSQFEVTIALPEEAS